MASAGPGKRDPKVREELITSMEKLLRAPEAEFDVNVQNGVTVTLKIAACQMAKHEGGQLLAAVLAEHC